MCGIVGVVYRDRERAVPAELIHRMSGSIRHRGPDDDGFHIEGNVGLGMRRLSIIDLPGSAQPIRNEDGSAVIVYNGEIYNYRELRRGLVARGHRFRSRGDTETILHLYEELGDGCVSNLRGMFAFALWDARTRSLLLARDRFGMKPLYVVPGPWGIAFASELKALHAVGLTGERLDWQALDTYFQLGYVPAPATPFQNVRKLEPGHLLLWRESGPLTYRRYWDLPRQEVRSARNLERRVLEWLDESVAAHLVSDVPVAAFLSGGLDSSAVVSAMSMTGDAPHAYTARYHGSGAERTDETQLARLLAERCGARLTIVDVEPQVRDLLDPIVYALDEPHADESAIPTWLISQRVAADYKVALAGTGGDELFAGYLRHIGFLLGELYSRFPARARRIASDLARRIPEPRGARLGVYRLKRFLRTGSRLAPERYFDLQNRYPEPGAAGLYVDDLARTLTGSEGKERFCRLWTDGGAPRGVRGALYLDYKTYLPDDLLHLSDRLAMAHSLEVRVPFVDHVLVERVYPIPDRQRIGPLRNKRLLRRALRGRLPDPHFSAPKRGFVGPTAAWLRNELRDVLLDELAPDRMARLGFFEPKTVERLLDEHFSRRQNREGILWELLCFATWYRLFIENRPTPVPVERAPGVAGVVE